jgi:hydroxyacylglutathione hydrolase
MPSGSTSSPGSRRSSASPARVRSRPAFVGDVLFHGSIGRTDFPRGDFDTLIRSITQELWPLGADIEFVPGHGPMSTFGEERRSNPFVADAALAEREMPRWRGGV